MTVSELDRACSHRKVVNSSGWFNARADIIRRSPPGGPYKVRLNRPGIAPSVFLQHRVTLRLVPDAHALEATSWEWTNIRVATIFGLFAAILLGAGIAHASAGTIVVAVLCILMTAFAISMVLGYRNEKCKEGFDVLTAQVRANREADRNS